MRKRSRVAPDAQACAAARSATATAKAYTSGTGTGRLLLLCCSCVLLYCWWGAGGYWGTGKGRGLQQPVACVMPAAVSLFRVVAQVTRCSCQAGAAAAAAVVFCVGSVLMGSGLFAFLCWYSGVPALARRCMLCTVCSSQHASMAVCTMMVNLPDV